MKQASAATLFAFLSHQASGQVGTKAPGIEVKFHHDFIDIAKEFYINKLPDFTHRRIEADNLPKSYRGDVTKISKIKYGDPELDFS
jgi:hypothetical protein